MNKVVIAVLFCAVSGAVSFADEVEPARINKWRLSVGGAFNGSVRGRVGARNMPVPAEYVLPAALSLKDNRAAAYEKAQQLTSDKGGAIGLDDGETGIDGLSKDWYLPAEYFVPDNPNATGVDRAEGKFYLPNSYYGEEITGSMLEYNQSSDYGIDSSFGVSAELSREIWSYDESFKNRWGVDFAAAFSYFFNRDFYRAHGTVTRNTMIRTENGHYETIVDPGDALMENFESDVPQVNQYVNGVAMYGDGPTGIGGFSPMLQIDDDHIIVPTADAYTVDKEGVRTETASTSYSAKGHYREMEMLFLLRPWYEVTDWWRLYAQVGVGVSWGHFATRFSSSTGVGKRETFDQWDVYGVAGLGTLLRYADWCLSIDFIGRFWRDDMDVNGDYVQGSIRRADWGFRVMAGYEF